MSACSASYEAWRKILREERLPAVVVDLDAFDQNLSQVREIAVRSGKKLRVATKSIRVVELIKRALESGAPLEGLMCFSVEEAAFLYAQGFDDLLIAYPTLQNSDLEKLRALVERGALVALVVDSEQGAHAASQAMSGCKSGDLRVVLEVDLSLRFLGLHLGVRRSPLRCVSSIERMLDQISKMENLRVVGVMGYEAQVAGLGDRNPFKKFLNPIAHLVRKISVRLSAKKRAQISELLKRKGIKIEIFNGGGTGSLNFAAEEKALTEITAGSALLCPHLFDYYSNIHFEPACFFALQAVRSSDPGYVTCQGGGYIASGEPGWDKVPLPFLPLGSELVSTEAAGEVQTPLKLSRSVELGDPVLFRHAKAGELAERFSEYLLVSQGLVISRAKTYRGMGSCFF